MTAGSFSRLHWARQDDSGFVLPFSLMLLSVAAVLAAAVLYTANHAAIRVTREEDGIRAHELARSALEWGVAKALAGQTGTYRFVYAGDGELSVTISSGGGAPSATTPSATDSTVTLSAVGTTVYGGKAAISAVLNVSRDEWSTWTDSP